MFDLIQRFGRVSDSEMYSVFNMGIGFCITAPSNEVEIVKEIAKKHNVDDATWTFTRNVSSSLMI
ncbi:MAG: AIR synthase-related protein [bacterium]